jgi:hypothetical protein
MYAMNIQNDIIVNQNKWPTLFHDRADVTVGYFKFNLDLYFICLKLFLKFQVNQTTKTWDNVWKQKLYPVHLFASMPFIKLNSVYQKHFDFFAGYSR